MIITMSEAIHGKLTVVQLPMRSQSFMDFKDSVPRPQAAAVGP